MNWFWKRDKDVFRPVERLVFGAVESALPADLVPIFEEHVSTVNHVDRLGDGREVNLYRMKGRKITFPESRLIESDDEFQLATVVLKSAERKGTVAAKVWVVHGVLSEILFNAPMEKLRVTFAVKSVELNKQLSADPTPFRRGPILETLGLRWNVSDEQPAISDERRDGALELIGSVLPEDHLALMGEADGSGSMTGKCWVLRAFTRFPASMESRCWPNRSGFGRIGKIRSWSYERAGTWC